MCVAGFALAFIVPVDPTLSLSILLSRLLLAGGIMTATLLTWAVQHTFHVPVTRRALFPWGAAGGAGAVLLLAAQTNSLIDHRAFVVTEILRSVLICLTIRSTIDLAFGPVDSPIAWGSTTGEEPIPQKAAAEEVPAVAAEALRPAWMTDIERAAAHKHADLKLVSEEEAHERDASAPPRHKRPSG